MAWPRARGSSQARGVNSTRAACLVGAGAAGGGSASGPAAPPANDDRIVKPCAPPATCFGFVIYYTPDVRCSFRPFPFESAPCVVSRCVTAGRDRARRGAAPNRGLVLNERMIAIRRRFLKQVGTRMEWSRRRRKWKRMHVAGDRRRDERERDRLVVHAAAACCCRAAAAAAAIVFERLDHLPLCQQVMGWWCAELTCPRVGATWRGQLANSSREPGPARRSDLSRRDQRSIGWLLVWFSAGCSFCLAPRPTDMWCASALPGHGFLPLSTLHFFHVLCFLAEGVSINKPK
jgi:hypothetical protein